MGLRNSTEALLEWRGEQCGKMNREAAQNQIMKTVARRLAAALGEVGATGGCRAEGSDTTLAAGQETGGKSGIQDAR